MGSSRCPRCGSTMQTTDMKCGLCRRPALAPPGWELPEHDAPGYAEAQRLLDASFTTCAPAADWITPADIGMQSSVSAEEFRAELDRLGVRSRADLR